MRQFSFGNAWSYGVRFFTPQGLNHAIILLGVGVAAPTILQLVIAGGATPLANPAMIGGNAFNPAAFASIAGTVALLMLVSYVCNFGALFGSLRLGLGAGENLGGAIVYGIVTAVLLVALIAVVFGIAGFVGVQSGGAGGALFIALLIGIAFVLFFAVLYPVLVTMMCLVMAVVLLIVMATGASLPIDNPAFAAGAGVGMFIILAIILLLFWATARLSVTTAAMAQRGTFNLLAGMGDSWRLTAANQWRILGYLSLLAVVLLVVFFILGVVLGAGMAASMQAGMQGGTPPAPGAGAMIAGAIIGALFLYLSVLVPAGIYRELVPSANAAETFQ